MQFLRINRVALGLLVLICLMQPQPSQADSKTYTIDTIDGVKLKVNYYRGNKGKDGVTVLLLHHFDKQGGDANKGWKGIAETIQKAGHNVVTFDFRGHGESTGVEKEKFWSAEFPYNTRYIRKTAKDRFPETISHSEFDQRYYAYLVNDIAAVRAFLDRLNDSGEVNTSNIVVIGAGQGATLGALWMASEFKRRQAIPFNPVVTVPAANRLPINAFDMREPAGKDFAAGIFLSISPTIGGLSVPLISWIEEIGKEQKVPLAFVYGKEDKGDPAIAQALLKKIDPNYRSNGKPNKGFELFREHGVATKLSGSQLLAPEFRTQDWIIKDYLNDVFQNRPLVEVKTREFDKYPAFWISTNMLTLSPVRLSPTDKAPRPLPLSQFGIKW